MPFGARVRSSRSLLVRRVVGPVLVVIVIVSVGLVIRRLDEVPRTHERTTALDGSTGQVVWTSGDLAHLAAVNEVVADGATGTLTVYGIDDLDTCGGGPGRAAAFDIGSGKLLRQFAARRRLISVPDRSATDPPRGDVLPNQPSTWDMASDAATMYEVTESAGVPAPPRIAAVARGDGSVRWSRVIPLPVTRSFVARDISGTLYKGVLYVAVSLYNHEFCGGA